MLQNLKSSTDSYTNQHNETVVAGFNTSVNNIVNAQSKSEQSLKILKFLMANSEAEEKAEKKAETEKKSLTPSNIISDFLKNSGEKLPSVSLGSVVAVMARKSKPVGWLLALVSQGYDIKVGLAYQNKNFFSDSNSEKKSNSWHDLRGEIEFRLPSFVLAGLASTAKLIMNKIKKPLPETRDNPNYVRYKTFDYLINSALITGYATPALQAFSLLNPKNPNFVNSVSKIKFSDSIINLYKYLTFQKIESDNKFQIGLSVDTDIASWKQSRNAPRLLATTGVEIKFDKENPVAVVYNGVKYAQKFFGREFEFNSKAKWLEDEIIR